MKKGLVIVIAIVGIIVIALISSYNGVVSKAEEVDNKLLKASIDKLNKREKNIMELRYGFKGGDEKTQKEVADMLRNITKLYI